MKKFKPVILTSIICAIVLALVAFFIPHMDWSFLPYLILSGCFLVWTQKEYKSYKFLVNLLIGSLMLGFLAMLFIFLKMYLLSHFIFNAPLPLRELWDEDTLILALVYVFLCFLGGFLGIVLKGFYSLYKEKLNWVIVFGGPLLATIASLSVFKLKAGGTVVSAYYGVPYSFFTYQIKDFLDNFRIDKWIFSPGSLYCYIVFDYLFYFFIFVLFFCVIKVLNKRFDKKINSVLILFGLLVLMIVAFISFLPAKKSYIDYEIAGASRCEQDKDCVSPGTTCPFGCGVAVNRKEADRISSLIYSFPHTCEDYGLCSQLRTTTCLQGRCAAAIVHSPEAHWKIIVEAVENCQVKSIMQTHDLTVEAELKRGITINAKEPAIDDIFEIVAAAKEKCGEIIMATE